MLSAPDLALDQARFADVVEEEEEEVELSKMTAFVLGAAVIIEYDVRQACAVDRYWFDIANNLDSSTSESRLMGCLSCV